MRSLSIVFGMFCLLAGLAAFPAPVPAQESCFACHERKNFSARYNHGPVAQGKCGECHNPHAARYPGLLQDQGAKLCYGCHQRAKAEHSQGKVHQPVRDGKCLECHAPHSSNHAGLLRVSLAEGCFSCHKDLARQAKVAHAPFAKGQCNVCHQPHQARHGSLLRQEADALCLSCHAQAQASPGHQGFPRRVTGCLSCHHPHGSDRKGVLRQHLHPPFARKNCASCHGSQASGSDTCLSCHQGVKASMLKPHNHMIAGLDNGCTQCHSPHAGDDKTMLKRSGNKVCQTCHAETFARSAGSLHRHPAIGSCGECHEVHGSDRVAMLKADGNQVCSTCHLTQGEFSHPVGEKVIDQRTGQPMTCVTCHDPMGTDYQFHLVLSGKKELCVQCHRSY